MAPQSDAQLAYERLLLQLPTTEAQRLTRAGTPLKASQAFSYITSGYTENLSAIKKDGLFAQHADDAVVLRDLPLHSTCEHHLLPFFGYCHIAYLPAGQVLALSRINRLLKMYSRRLQLQERLSAEIADGLLEMCGAHAVAVVTEARHLCMELRADGSCGATAKCTALRGETSSARALLSLL